MCLSGCLKGNQLANSKKIQGICAYCGKVGDVTGDHVVPQCLWPGRVPKNAPVVDACKTCNHISKSSDDTYLRDVLVTNAASATSPRTKRIYPKFLRSMNRNQSQMVNDLRDVRLVEKRQINEMTLNILASQTADERIVRILSRIARGLYNFRTGLIMPVTVPITVTGLHDPEYVKHIEGVILNKYGSGFSIGDGSVFQCLFAISPVESIDTCWVPTFYNSTQFLIFTGLLTQALGDEDKRPIDKQPVI